MIQNKLWCIRTLFILLHFKVLSPLVTDRVEKELSEINARSDYLPMIQFLKACKIHREVLLAESSMVSLLIAKIISAVIVYNI